MRRILVLISILFTLESCLPSSSDTTLIRGRIEGGIADKVSVYVLDYGINEDIEVLDGAFTYEVPTNKAIVATFSCTLDGDEQEVAIIPDGFPLTITFKPDGATQVSDNRKSINHRLAEEEMGIPFYEDAVLTNNRNRIEPEFVLNRDPAEPNVILYDDIITTGITIRETRRLLLDKGHTVLIVVAIRNQ